MRIRAWDRPKCGTHLARDRNAAKREAIYNAVSIQFCDGWGEGFLGPTNNVEDEEAHVRYYVE